MRAQLPYKRVDRVSDLVRRIVSETLINRVHHHRTEGVTVTDVAVTPDLRHARIYFSVMDPSQAQDIKRILDSIRPLLQKQLASELKTRNTPIISFYYDNSLDYGDKIESLLKKIKEEIPQTSED